MKKDIIKTAFFFFTASCFWACSEDELRTRFPESVPVIESADLSSGNEADPSAIVFGDSVLVTAALSDPKTPLSTLEVEIVVNDNLIERQQIRTQGYNCIIARKFKVPLVAFADDNMDVEAYLTLTNVEGNTVTQTIKNKVHADRPGFPNRMYMVMQDGTIYNLSKKLGSQIEFQSSRMNLSGNNIKFKLAEKITGNNEIDYSGIVWGNVNGALAVCAEEDGFYEYTDPLILTMRQFLFNVYSFDFEIDAERLAPVTINGRQMGVETMDGNTYLSSLIAFTLDQELEFSGIADLQNTLNPDFFACTSGNNARFLGLPGTYKLLYNNAEGFMYVEQTDALYPDALWLDGTGLGFPGAPYKTTTSWNWNKPEDYVFCRKISDGIFQATFYAESFDMKFFHQRMWGGEENSEMYTLTPASLIKTGVDNQGQPNGNWVAGADVIPGVYRVIININDHTTVIERIN
ncbi:MAG: hypothetical protein FWF54_10780 [Candidatus Azobacteroides sp.]|nr:hypothetical protein [Candidatus Azobacteroides sp.]